MVFDFRGDGPIFRRVEGFRVQRSGLNENSVFEIVYSVVPQI